MLIANDVGIVNYLVGGGVGCCVRPLVRKNNKIFDVIYVLITFTCVNA